MEIKLQEAFTRAANLIADAEAILITAGAGMGVDSGLPDFRGNTGFWQAYPALAGKGLSFSDIAQPQTFIDDPRLAWGFYGHRLNLYRDTVPHRGFDILHKWTSVRRSEYFIYTSNVDGQFQKSGFDTSQILECHGSIHEMQCTRPCRPSTWSTESFLPQVDDVACQLMSELPKCPKCGALARPNILMFYDSNWVEEPMQARDFSFNNWVQTMVDMHIPTVTIELGAGKAISTVRRLGEMLPFPLIRINPRDYEYQGRKEFVGIPTGALEGLTGIEAILNQGI